RGRRRDEARARHARRGHGQGDERHGGAGGMRRALAGLACLALLVPACGGSGSHRSEITVLAAASLTAAFTKIGADFERANPDVTVRFSFGPSDGLALQIL